MLPARSASMPAKAPARAATSDPTLLPFTPVLLYEWPVWSSPVEFANPLPGSCTPMVRRSSSTPRIDSRAERAASTGSKSGRGPPAPRWTTCESALPRRYSSASPTYGAKPLPCVLMAHVVWATRHRAPVLTPDIEPWLRGLMAEKAREAGGQLLMSGVDDDHVHTLLRFRTTVALATLVQRLKGATSHECNKRRLLPRSLRWQTGYWAETFGPKSLAPLVEYLSSQREHHDCRAMDALSEDGAPTSRIVVPCTPD